MDIERLLEVFYSEAKERLDELESRLLELENHPEHREALDAAFRAAHNLKGSSGLAGIHALSDVAHIMEDIFGQARDGQAPIRKDDISLLLSGVDLLRSIVEIHERERQERLPPEYQEIVDRLKDRAGRKGTAERLVTPQSGTEASARRRYRIRMQFRPDFFATGQDPLFLLFELVGLGHPHEIHCDTDQLPPLQQLDPEQLYLHWEVVLDTDVPRSRIESVFEFAQYDGTIEIEEIATPNKRPPEAVEKSTQPQVTRPGEEEPKIQPVSPRPTAETLRVRSDRVNRVIDLASDLAIQIGRLEATIVEKGGAVCSDVSRKLEAVRSLVHELQHDALQLRMVPVGEQFGRFARLVRDTAELLGKKVSLIIEAGETELDRQLLDVLWDPLKHLIRNAIDHGVEDPEERRRLGKPIPARVWLRAFEKSGRVIIEVEDDGRGLDLEKIRTRAKELGLPAAKADSDPAELLRLLSLPGFSTAEQVTEVSGRGVGLDVVFQAVQKLGGHFTVSTRTGEGTAFRISVPLTQVVLDAVLLRDGSQIFLVPANAVLEIFPWDGQGASVSEYTRVIYHRGKLYPAIPLSDLPIFGGHGSWEKNTAMLVSGEAKDFVLIVDEVLEPRQVVVKSLEESWRRVPGLSGATILSDGSVGLILDLHYIEKLLVESKTAGNHVSVPAQETAYSVTGGEG